jgi:hypothetical protein
VSDQAIIYWHQKGSKPQGRQHFLKSTEPLVKASRDMFGSGLGADDCRSSCRSRTMTTMRRTTSDRTTIATYYTCIAECGTSLSMCGLGQRWLNASSRRNACGDHLVRLIQSSSRPRRRRLRRRRFRQSIAVLHERRTVDEVMEATLVFCQGFATGSHGEEY